MAAVQEEIRAFWLLFQLTGGQGRQAFRDYYGVPRRSKVSVGAPTGDVSCHGEGKDFCKYPVIQTCK